MKLKSIVKYFMDWTASRFGQHRQNKRTPRLWIVTYHRILPANDPRFANEEPGMLVTPETFKKHLRILKNEFTIVSLNDWIERKKSNAPLPLKACAITFDDGWLDNYEFAFPILKEEKVCATLFAVSEMLGTKRDFWPNRVDRILQHPQSLAKSFDWLNDLSNKKKVDREMLSVVINALKSMPENELLAKIKSAESALGIGGLDNPVVVNHEQLLEMSNSGFIDVGSHTRNHVRLLDSVEENLMQSEIVKSKADLEKLLEKPVNLFCYPNGDLCRSSVDMVTANYDAAVTTTKGINLCSSDSYQLTRFNLHESSSKDKQQLLARLSGWW